MLEYILQNSISVSLLVAIVVLLLLCLFYSSLSSQGKSREPPGPKPLPLLGNLLQLDLKRVDISLLKLSKTYGPVFTVYFGPKKVVVLAGYKTVKQALVNQAVDFGKREITPLFHDFNKGNGLLFANGSTWKEMRRFSLSTMRDIGMGKSIAEGKIIDECQYLIKSFEQHEGKPFNNVKTIIYASANIVAGLMFGKRFEYTDPVFHDMVERDRETIVMMGSASTQIYNMFPCIGYFLKNWWRMTKNVEDSKDEIKRAIAELKGSWNPEILRCFIDAFLVHKQKQEESEIKGSQYNYTNLVDTVMDLFAAGTDTTANTLRWCLLFMTKYPHFQDQVQEELSRMVGSRQVRIQDRKNMPFTNAVIHESQRLANIVPMAFPRQTSKDVSFQGYFIKEGTMVITLLTSVLYDESEWETPHTFNPYHFLDKEGKFIKRDAFMPFSAGRRACVGESLVRMDMFLFFSSLLQQFRFTPPPGVTVNELDISPVIGFTLSPYPYELCAVSRNGHKNAATR